MDILTVSNRALKDFNLEQRYVSSTPPFPREIFELSLKRIIISTVFRETTAND